VKKKAVGEMEWASRAEPRRVVMAVMGLSKAKQVPITSKEADDIFG
jgi:hypothetical protein